MYKYREELEKSVVVSLFGDWTDNPFEIDDIKKVIENLDVSLFTHKGRQLVVRAVKKMNTLDEYKNSLPTIDMVLAWVELSVKEQVFKVVEATIFDCIDKTPLCLDNLNNTIDLLKQYKLKDELRSIE